MIKTLKYAFLSIVAIATSLTLYASPVYAACTGGGLKIPTCSDIKTDGSTTNLEDNPIILWIQFFVNLLSVVIVAGAVLMIAVAGLQYTSARDNSQSVQKAKEKLFSVVLGLVAYFFLYGFVQWLIPGGVF
jgi:hypothetical protein